MMRWGAGRRAVSPPGRGVYVDEVGVVALIGVDPDLRLPWRERVEGSGWGSRPQYQPRSGCGPRSRPDIHSGVTVPRR